MISFATRHAATPHCQKAEQSAVYASLFPRCLTDLLIAVSERHVAEGFATLRLPYLSLPCFIAGYFTPPRSATLHHFISAEHSQSFRHHEPLKVTSARHTLFRRNYILPRRHSRQPSAYFFIATPPVYTSQPILPSSMPLIFAALFYAMPRHISIAAR